MLAFMIPALIAMGILLVGSCSTIVRTSTFLIFRGCLLLDEQQAQNEIDNKKGEAKTENPTVSGFRI